MTHSRLCDTCMYHRVHFLFYLACDRIHVFSLRSRHCLGRMCPYRQQCPIVSCAISELSKLQHVGVVLPERAPMAHANEGHACRPYQIVHVGLNIHTMERESCARTRK